jgi:hypothetical protein
VKVEVSSGAFYAHNIHINNLIVSVKDNSRTLSIRYPASVPNLKSFILGSETEIRIVLQGYDEIGRPVTIPVNRL